MSLPPTVPGPPNALVAIQPGMTVLPVCVVSPSTASTLTTGIGRGNVSVNVQPGMNVQPVVLVDANGQYVTPGGTATTAGSLATTTVPVNVAAAVRPAVRDSGRRNVVFQGARADQYDAHRHARRPHRHDRPGRVTAAGESS